MVPISRTHDRRRAGIVGPLLVCCVGPALCGVVWLIAGINLPASVIRHGLFTVATIGEALR